MPFNSSPYTDLQLPSVNEDNNTFGTIINNYFQGLETKLKGISDRVNAAGVGDNSTLAGINSNISDSADNIEDILPDPYSGDYTTTSTWPSYNTELTALGLSPPQTASEIEAFFAGSDFTSFVNFLNTKLSALDTLVATAETDICIANKYSDVVLNPENYLVWTQTSQTTHSFTTTNSSIAAGTYTNATFIPGFGTGYPPPSWNSGNALNGVTMYTSLPAASGYGLADVGTTRTVVSDSRITFVSNSTVVINVPDQNSGTQYATNYTFQLASAWNGAGPYYRTYTSNGPVVSGNVYDYNMTMTTYTLTLPAPDTSTC
jgi:hypothetical protein